MKLSLPCYKNIALIIKFKAFAFMSNFLLKSA